MILLFTPTLILSLPISSGLALSIFIAPYDTVPIILEPAPPDDSLPEEDDSLPEDEL